jgi:hypothetical protein
VIDLVKVRELITNEFRDSASEPHIGPALAEDLVTSKYTFLSSGAPITRKQEDTLTPLDFGATLVIRPRYSSVRSLHVVHACSLLISAFRVFLDCSSFGSGTGNRSGGPIIRRLKSGGSSGNYEDSFLSSGDKKDGTPRELGAGEHHDALSTV